MSAEAGTLDELARPLTAEEEGAIRGRDASARNPARTWVVEDRRRLLATLDAARTKLGDCEDALTTVEVAYDREAEARAEAGTLDEAWKAAEAALPEGRDLGIRRMPDGSVYAWASTQPGTGSSSDTYQEGRDSGKGDSPAAALLALATALRTPKPEGDR